MKNMLKKLIADFSVSLFMLALSGCNPLSSMQSGTNAVEYNNKVIGYQGEIIQGILSMVNEISSGNGEEIEKKRQELVTVIDKNIASLNALEAMPDDQGLKATASDLQYKHTTEGKGVSPDANDKVTVHYHGTLIDGTIFDSSVDRGQPATFGLNQVIQGWTEGLQLMKEGGKTNFLIPSNLAYGEQGMGGVIPPNASLIFEVELIKINQ